MRIVFMGTPDFAVPTLDALVAAGHDVVAVYTQPPRPAGRGKALTAHRRSSARAEASGIEVRTPLSLSAMPTSRPRSPRSVPMSRWSPPMG